MPTRRVRRFPALPVSSAIVTLVGIGEVAAAGPPTFDDAFWSHWGDGQAEICTYDLVYPRYGADRDGLAVTIFVTETFSHEDHVKADPGMHAKSDESAVLLPCVRPSSY